MKKYIQNKLAMYKVVRQLMTENETTWNSIPAVGDAFNDLTTKIVELEELAVKQGSNLTGHAKSKTKLSLKTVGQTRAIAAAISVFADSVSNEVLKAKVKLSHANFDRASREKVLSKMEEVIAITNEWITELEPFGVKPEHLEELTNNYEALKAQMYNSRLEVVKRKQITLAISVVSKEVDAILKSSLDQLMKMVKSIDGKFYDKYLSARMIIDYGMKHKQSPSDDNTSFALD